LDDLDLGYLLAVAGAGMWAPRALATWLRALGSPRALVQSVRQGEEPPPNAERLSATARGRLALIDDVAARAALDAAARSGARVVLDSDADYPANLRDLCDAPLVLYVRGALECTARRTVAIVGSRAASGYGRSVAASMAAEFAAFGATVVSGLARGVDAAAHKGAIDAGAPTVAVLGSGVQALYPDYHALLADEIVAGGGAVLSEFPPGEPARAFQFPMRNRVVAALAQATVVVEASARSGALITARLADELGRRVFAVPGDVVRPTSRGTNGLIADGVALVTSAADIAGLMGWGAELTLPLAPCASPPNALLDLLTTDGCSIDELAARSGQPVGDLSAKLTLLELAGAVERRPGGAYAAVRARPAANAGA
jgi:DNA processing protein